MQVSINQLSEWTGKDRRTIAARLKDLAYVDGAKGAYLYEAPEALELIYQTDAQGKSLDQAKTEQALEAAALSRVRREELQRTRIPLAIVTGLWDAALQSFTATLKAARGKKLEPGKINELIAVLRSKPLPPPNEW